MNIKLICDSLCDVPKELVEKYNIDVIPLTIVIDGKEYKDGVDISDEEFYRMMKKDGVVPKTSQATYMQFKEVFEKYKDEYDIVCINGSSMSSGTYQSAVMAKNDTDGEIHIFDTLNLSLGSGQYVVKACELIDNNMSAKDIINELDKLRKSVNLIFVVDTLEYLKRSGRVSLTTAAIGNMLKLKLVFEVKDGKITLIDKIRGKKKVASTMTNIIKERYDGLEDKNMIIGCGANKYDFKFLEEEVQQTIKSKSMYFTKGGACICSHTGPDILAISCSE